MMIKKIIALSLILFGAAGMASGQEFNDLQIASIAVTANQVDIEFGEIAVERSENEAIVDFAETMIRDHSAVIDQAVALVNELGVEPDSENELTQQLRDMSADSKESLRNASSADFDETYINNEVNYHETVIEVVRDILIPQADNGQLRELLEAVLPSLEAHLEHAKMVQGNLEEAHSGGNGY